MGSSKNNKGGVSIQKTLRNVYFNVLKFRSPLQIMPDSYFLDFFIRTYGSSSPSSLKEYLENLTGSRIKLLTTNCLLKHLRSEKNEKPELKPILHIIKEFEILRHCCGVAGQSEPEICLLKCTNSDNRYKYCIATGSESLRDRLKNRIVPIFYLGAGGGNVILQSLGEAVLKRVNKVNNDKMHVSSEEKRLLQCVAPVADSNSGRKNFKKKRAKGPNPLSMKKKRNKGTR
jgi:rRNA-processing protein FCF1